LLFINAFIALFYSIFLKRLLVLFIPVLLAACSTEESFNGSTGVGLSSGASLNEVALSWLAPVEREDGTPISMAEIGGYRIYYGTSQGNYTKQVSISDSNTMHVTLSDLVSGTYYIVITTYDMDGLESAYSMEVITSV